MALFSGTNFEDLIASLTWLCTLPPGWSVEWDARQLVLITLPLSDVFRMGFIDASHLFASYLLLLPLKQ